MESKIYKLGDIAEIIVSSIDKKSKDDERMVKLCNFVDVYHNWAITESMVANFMTATANNKNIEKFSLKRVSKDLKMDLSKFGKDFANKKSMNLTGLAITSEQLKAKKEQKEASTIFDIELTHIKADPNQPRKDFDEEQILELSQDIELHGLIQPIVVRKAGDEDYFIVAGERRFRAYQLLGKTTIRAIIADKNWQENDIGYIQVSENLKRADLKFYEEVLLLIFEIRKYCETLMKRMLFPFFILNIYRMEK